MDTVSELVELDEVPKLLSKKVSSLVLAKIVFLKSDRLKWKKAF